MFTGLLTRSPQFLLFTALVIAGGAGSSCGKMGAGAEATTETASEEVSASVPARKIAVGSRTYDTKEVRPPPQVLPSANETVTAPIGVVFDPSDFTIEPKGTPPPPWEPAGAYEAMKDNCITCHYAFRFKESVVEHSNRLLASIRANGGAKPMPPSSQNPNYTTFRNTAQGMTLIAFLEANAPAPTPTPTATPTSVYSYADVQPIIQASCVAGCHSSAGGSQVSGLPFDNKAQVVAQRSHMWQQLSGNYMPRPPSTISPSNRAKLLDWLQYGGGSN